jgi:hypothetical protein
VTVGQPLGDRIELGSGQSQRRLRHARGPPTLSGVAFLESRLAPARRLSRRALLGVTVNTSCRVDVSRFA